MDEWPAMEDVVYGQFTAGSFEYCCSFPLHRDFAWQVQISNMGEFGVYWGVEPKKLIVPSPSNAPCIVG
jgi:hypothetical protein